MLVMRRSPLAAAVALLAGAVLAFGAVSPAAAASSPDAGETTTPAQPYLNNPNTGDWLGSYLVGVPVWPTEFGLLEPDAAEIYNGPGAATTKWGTAPDPTAAARLAFLLWAYGDTPDDAEAAALAHLIYAALSAPQTPADLSPANDFRHIAYDALFHLTKLSPAAQAAVASMLATPANSFGPWTPDLVAPSGATIGAASDWSLQVLGSGGTGVGSVPVTVTVTGGTLPGGATTASFVTPADGSPLLIPITPTSAAPIVDVEVVAPTAALSSIEAIDVSVSPALRRGDNVTTLTASVTGAAAAAPAAGPALAVSGPRTDPGPTAAGGLLAVLLGTAMVLAATPRRRRAHRA